MEKEGLTIKTIRRIFRIIYKSVIFNIAKKVLGIIFIFFGIISLFLPLSPGILLILIGIALYENKTLESIADKYIKKWKRKHKFKLNRS